MHAFPGYLLRLERAARRPQGPRISDFGKLGRVVLIQRPTQRARASRVCTHRELVFDDVSVMSVVPRLSSTLLSPSPALPYNLSTFDRSRFAQLEQGVVGASQFAQDLWVDAALGSMRGGLVVESGAFNGESFSNSLLFEVGRGWRCLLVEANPTLQVQIEAVHRRCHLLKGGLSTTAHESTFDFVMGGAVGGLADSVDTKKVLEAQRRYKNIAGGTVSVPCYPLHRVLAHMAQQEAKAQSAQLTAPRVSVRAGRFTVDFWSLDTEGSECAPRLALALALTLALALALALTPAPAQAPYH